MPIRSFYIALLTLLALFSSAIAQDSGADKAMLKKLQPVKDEILAITVDKPVKNTQLKKLKKKLKSIRKKFQADSSLKSSRFGNRFESALDSAEALLECKTQYLETKGLTKSPRSGAGHQRNLSRLESAIGLNTKKTIQDYKLAKEVTEGLSGLPPESSTSDTGSSGNSDHSFLAGWLLVGIVWIGVLWPLLSGSARNTRSTRAWARIFTGRGGSPKNIYEFTREGEPLAYWLTMLFYFVVAVAVTITYFFVI